MKKPTRPDPECTIAVLEESSDNIYSLRFILQSLGYPVRAVEVTPNVVAELEALGPKIVLIDMLISGGRGPDLLKILKQSSLSVNKILAITADAVPMTPAELQAAGADVVLVKPYSVAEIQAILDDCDA